MQLKKIKPALKNDLVIMKFAIFVNFLAIFVLLNDECPQILLQLFVGLIKDYRVSFISCSRFTKSQFS